MTRLVLAPKIFLMMGGLLLAADIIIAEDAVPFTVTASDLVRIPVKGIAGTQVTAKVVGPAKETVSLISYRKTGKPLIGPGDHVVELKPTGAGKVKVEITTKPPTGPAVTDTYEFEVK